MPTRHDKIFTRPDGTRVKIVVAVEINYTAHVWISGPKKRKFVMVDPSDDWEYKVLPFGSEARERFWNLEKLKHCTIEEIQEVAIELWEMNKPDFGKYK